MLRRTFLIVYVLTAFLLSLSSEHSKVGHAQSMTRRLTNTDEVSTSINPTLSDNGLIVAFESSADIAKTGGPANFHSLRLELMGDYPNVVEVARTRSVAPAVSHDGQVIAFASNEDLIGENADRNSEIYLFDNSTITQLTHTVPGSSQSRLIDGNSRPSISNDGREIAFASNRNLTGQNPEANSAVFLYDSSSGRLFQIASAQRDGLLHDPKVSGDGSRIVFLIDHIDTLGSELVSYEPATGVTSVLASHIPKAQFTNTKAISNDGKRVVYSAEIAVNQTQVVLYDVDNGLARQITNLGSRTTDVPLQPTISGDGKRIAFATRRKVTGQSDGSVELYVLDLPTEEILQITDGPASATAEVTSALNSDGTRIVFNFPRILSGAVVNNETINNSEIYFSTIAARPLFASGRAFNAASLGNEASPGNTVARESIVVVKGSALASRTISADVSDTGAFPRVVAGTHATIGTQLVQLIYISPAEVVLAVPPGLPAGATEIVITNAEGFETKAPVVITNAAPGLFSFRGDGQGSGVILDANTFLTAPFDPTSGQLRLTVFATGVRHASAVAADFDGEKTEVESVRPSNVPGLDEIHVLVPPSLRGAGTVSLKLTADGIDSNKVSLDFSGSPLRDVLINEFLADPPDGIAGDANHDGVRSASNDEFVELVNTTPRDLDISNYRLITRSIAGADIDRHVFPKRTILSAGTSVVVFGGGNPNLHDSTFGGALIQKASSGSLSLNNSGGAILLRDEGARTVSSVSYGAELNRAADANQSVTRSPDIEGKLTPFQLAAGSDLKLFSPGTRIDGSPFLSTPAISRIIVSATRYDLIVGERLHLDANALDITNNQIDHVLFNWQSTNSEAASIDESGVLIGNKAGVADITASARGVTSLPVRFIVSNPAPSPTPTPTATPTPVPSPSVSPIPSASTRVLISEFRTRGPNGANDEFIELYNSGDAAVDISGWKIKGSNSTGSVAVRLVVNAGTRLPAHAHFLATNISGYSGIVSGDQTYTSGVVNDGGLALTLENDTIMDQVGLSPGSVFREGMHLAPLPSDANQSYERKPGRLLGNAQDTNDNLFDFQLSTPSDPQNLGSQSTPGPSPTPSVSPSPTPTLTPSPTPLASPSPSLTPTPSPVPAGILISQIFSGGGNSGAPFRNDFVELFNAGKEGIDLAGWSIQYASATASTWSITNLNSFVLAPGQHYLVQEASGGLNGAALSAPDTNGTINLAATAGKIALVTNAASLSGSCPTDPRIVDLVGYGTTTNCFRGIGPAPALSNTTATLRTGGGCSNTQNNSVDFVVATPMPRNSSVSMSPCAQTAPFTNDEPSAFCAWVLKVYLATLSF